MSSEPRRVWRAHAMVLGCALIAYVNALQGPFQFDDFGVIVDADSVHSLRAYWQQAGHGLRPLLKLSYALCWALGGSPLVFHVFNVLVHVLNVELVMRVVAAALDRKRRWPFVADEAGVLAAGLVFALHPLQTEAVTYISGRSSSLSTTFVLLCVLGYASAARAERGAGGLVLALLAYGAAVATKETTASVPLVLLLWELSIERPPLRVLARRQAPLWIALGGVLVAVVMHPAYFKLLYEATGLRPLAQSLAYQVAGAGYLLARVVLVHRLCIDPGLGFAALAPLELVASSAALAMLGVVAAASWRGRPAVACGAAWMLLHLLVPYVVLPRIDVVNERHMYLASVGGVMMLGAWWQALAPQLAQRASWAALARGVAVLATAGMIAATARRNEDYASPRALWESTVRTAPDNPRAHYNVGALYERAGQRALAREHYARALALEPRYQAARKRLDALAAR